MLESINRVLITLRPKQKFLDWLEESDRAPDGKTQDEMCFWNAYLMNECSTDSRIEVRQELEKHFANILFLEIESRMVIHPAPGLPATLEEFEEFFEWNYAEAVIDVCGGGILTAAEEYY